MADFELLVNKNEGFPDNIESRNDFDFFFKKGYVSILYGPSGVGKTTIALYISLLASKGRYIFNRLLKVSEPKKVAFLSLELYKEDIQMKLIPLMKRYKIKNPNITFFDLEDVNSVEGLERMLKKRNFNFVVVDSLILLFDNSKSLYDAVHVKNFFIAIRRLAKQRKAHIMFIHHTAKSREDMQENSFLGVSTIKYLATPFLYAGIWKNKLHFLKVEKSNFGSPFNTIQFYIDKQGAIRWYIRNNKAFERLSGKYEPILKHLKKSKEGIRTKELLKLSGLNKRTFYKYLNELEEYGVIKWIRKYSDVSTVFYISKKNITSGLVRS